MYVQYTLDSFADRCTSLARNLNNFINIIQQEDISLLDNYDCMREVGSLFNISFLSEDLPDISQVAHKNRAYYRQLRTDLHDLSTDGLYLQEGLTDDGANGMQKLSGNTEINDF